MRSLCRCLYFYTSDILENIFTKVKDIYRGRKKERGKKGKNIEWYLACRALISAVEGEQDSRVVRLATVHLCPNRRFSPEYLGNNRLHPTPPLPIGHFGNAQGPCAIHSRSQGVVPIRRLSGASPSPFVKGACSLGHTRLVGPKTAHAVPFDPYAKPVPRHERKRSMTCYHGN